MELDDYSGEYNATLGTPVIDNYANHITRRADPLSSNIHGENIVHSGTAMYQGRGCLWTVTWSMVDNQWRVYANHDCVWIAADMAQAYHRATSKSQDMLRWSNTEIDLFFGKIEAPKIIPQEYGEW